MMAHADQMVQWRLLPCRAGEHGFLSLDPTDSTSPESSPSSPGTPIQTPFRTPRSSGKAAQVLSATTARRMKVVGYPDTSEVPYCAPQSQRSAPSRPPVP